MKPRLCRSSWRAFASTHSLMLPSTSPREALLACPPFSPWNLPSFTLESTLFSSCSRSDPSLSRQDAALAHLDSLLPHDLVLWTDGSVPSLGKAALAYLPTALSVALRPLFPFQQAQYVQAFLLKPVPFCTLFAGLGSTNNPATSLLFFFYLTLVLYLGTLSSPPSFLLSQTLWQIWQELSSLSSCTIRLQWVPRHSFLLGNDTADEIAKWGALLVPYAIPCSLSRIHSCLFSDWRRTVSSKFFDTQIPLIFTKELVLRRHARCVLSHLHCYEHSLLVISYVSRIGRIENSSCSTCGHSSWDTSHLILH